MTRFDGLPTHVPPAGPACACRFCFLWGYMGPLPEGTPTARNPAPRPVTAAKGEPQKRREANLFDEVQS